MRKTSSVLIFYSHLSSYITVPTALFTMMRPIIIAVKEADKVAH